MAVLSARLLAVVDALPLREGLRVLEVGCGPGPAAREVAARIGSGRVLGIDRSPRAIAQAVAAGQDLARTGVLAFRCVAVEDLALEKGEAPYDVAFAVRVGALDGRHPAERALARLTRVLAPEGRLYVERNGRVSEVALRSP